MKVKNVDLLKKRLLAIPKEARTEIHKALRKSAEEMVSSARGFAPVDSGTLRNSIQYTFGEYRGSRSTLGAGGSGANDPELTVTIHAGGGDAYYAPFVEFGTVKMSAHPYFFPAYRLTKKRAKGRISRATTKAAKKVAGK